VEQRGAEEARQAGGSRCQVWVDKGAREQMLRSRRGIVAADQRRPAVDRSSDGRRGGSTGRETGSGIGASFDELFDVGRQRLGHEARDSWWRRLLDGNVAGRSDKGRRPTRRHGGRGQRRRRRRRPAVRQHQLTGDRFCFAETQELLQYQWFFVAGRNRPFVQNATSAVLSTTSNDPSFNTPIACFT